MEEPRACACRGADDGHLVSRRDVHHRDAGAASVDRHVLAAAVADQHHRAIHHVAEPGADHVDRADPPYGIHSGHVVTELTEPRTYTLSLPWARPPLRSNGTQPHFRVRSRIVREIRADVANLAQAQGMHRLTGVGHLTFQLHYAPGARRRIDPPNFYPTVKPCVDALTNPARKIDPRKGSRAWVGLTIVPDDTSEWVTLLDTVIVPPPEPGPRCWLTVTAHPVTPDRVSAL